VNWKIIGRSLKTADMRKRIFAVLGMLVIFRMLAQIPIPLADPTTLRQLLETLFTATQGTQLLGFFDTISGGALANFSIMLIGLGPYINASIIMQLMTQAIPKLETLNKEGEYGRRKINQITRLLTVPLAIIQSVGAIVLVRQAAQSVSGEDILAGATASTWILMVTALVAGSVLLMWLGELITEQSIGNGISLLITAGIVAVLPSTISSITSDVFSGSNSFSIFGRTINYNSETLYIALAITGLTVATTWVVVKLNEAQRRITINYAKRVQGNRTYGGVTTTLPIKLITAGVIPIIFAVAFLSVPSFVGQLMTGSRYAEAAENVTRVFQNPSSQYLREITIPQTTQLLNFGTPTDIEAQSGVVASFSLEPLIYPTVYFLLIVMFTFFYTGITFNAKEIAENLQKQGGFIEGIRSGKDTEKYLRTVVNRLTLFGSIALGLIALSPIIAQYWISTSITIGGTSVLILVAVALETLRQIESRALMITYDDYSSPDYLKGSQDDEDKPKKEPKNRRILRRKSA
jgi:preprotein translocase subunit SecY